MPSEKRQCPQCKTKYTTVIAPKSDGQSLLAGYVEMLRSEMLFCKSKIEKAEYESKTYAYYGARERAVKWCLDMYIEFST